ncbi:MAG: DUF427 domain-containing protein [Vicinamibacterales bacterium]|nr:DUF427 domain-containing protein [Vicinamibacterales bacterium]
MSGDERVPAWARRGRAGWTHTGAARPPCAIAPGPGQESVWDYPRPPVIVRDTREVIIRIGAHELARSRRAVRILETASAPTFYLPPDDLRRDWLEPGEGHSHCEWKGEAWYWTVVAPGQRLPRAVWSYPHPFPEFASIGGWFSCYPSMLECLVDGVRAQPQAGGFYGGWVTPEVVGPFKGAPGTAGW